MASSSKPLFIDFGGPSFFSSFAAGRGSFTSGSGSAGFLDFLSEPETISPAEVPMSAGFIPLARASL